jgi:hypothetical protein
MNRLMEAKRRRWQDGHGRLEDVVSRGMEELHSGCSSIGGVADRSVRGQCSPVGYRSSTIYRGIDPAPSAK